MFFKLIYNKWYLINLYVVYFFYNMIMIIECRILICNFYFQYFVMRDDELYQMFVVGVDIFDIFVDIFCVVIYGVFNIFYCK